MEAAARRLNGVAVETPLLEDPLLSRAAGRRVLVKAECLQRTGSFKIRGAWARLSAEPPERLAAGVLAVSSGNHAQAVAYASARLGARARIVMPADAPAMKRDAAAAYGAELVFYDRAGQDRDAALERLRAGDRGEAAVFAHPFDDPLVIAGQAGVGRELARQARALGATRAEVLVCAGGGGLASGVALALEAAGADGLRVRPVEPDGFDDWRRSLAAGARQTNPRAHGSICDAILTPTPGAMTWRIGRRLFGGGLAVSDDEAAAAMAAAARRLKLVVEPGGAVALAAALFRGAELDPAADAVIAVATGGNVDPETHARLIAAAPTAP
ncbi:MAG: pyridoxal-phosphate dependent enzyme [Pseudomonadota bacterium]